MVTAVLLFFAISGWSFVGLIAYHSAFSVDARRRREEERLTLNSLTAELHRQHVLRTGTTITRR
jgi:hypothetical protein